MFISRVMRFHGKINKIMFFLVNSLDEPKNHPRRGTAAPPGVVEDKVVLEGHVVAAVGPGAKFK